VRLRPIQTEGASASAEALAESKVDLAIVRGDLDVPKNAQAVATLRKNFVVLWAPPPVRGKGKKAGPRVSKISQLAGRKVGVVGKTQANVNLLKVILQQYGVDPGKVEVVQFPANEVAEAIRNQKADAYLAAGPLNSKITAEALAASTREGGTPTFLSIDASEAIAQNHPAYEATEIPAGTFGSADRPEEEVKTISFSHHIVARKGLSDVTIAAFTRQLFAIRQQLMSEFPLAAKIETPDTDKDAVIPAHPGAAAFVDGEEKTFLDRYSDFIWWEGRARRQLLAARTAARHDRPRAQERFDRGARPDAIGGRRHPAQHVALLRAWRDRRGLAHRLQHRAGAIPPRGR